MFRLPSFWIGAIFTVLLTVLHAADEPKKPSRTPPPQNWVTPAEWLKTQARPTFRAGHALAPLTRFGWELPLDASIELAEHWGYALEFRGYATAGQVEKTLNDPKHANAQIVALVAGDPTKCKLSVICSRELPKPGDVSAETWTRNADGKFLTAKGQSVDGNVWDARAMPVWSPEAPDAVWEEAGRLRAEPLRRIREKCPITVILNGGEYGLNVPGFSRKLWEQDPAIVKAKGDRSWVEYFSQRKARAETIIANAVRNAVPDRALYIYYTTGGGTHRNRTADWRDWTPIHEDMKLVGDLPSNECYFLSFNDGWIAKSALGDALTQLLNARGREIALGEPLNYNWLCGGWTRDKEGKDASTLSDIGLYTGFLKCCYSTGMIGGNAGYYAYPPGGFAVKFDPASPPHWLLQMVALGEMHALFSYQEEFIRNSDLLPGPEMHRWSKDQPAYEFPTDNGARVIARKHKQHDEWLITAWAANGQERDVTVEVPVLGKVIMTARASGTVCLARPAPKQPALTRLDEDGLRPTPRSGAR